MPTDDLLSLIFETLLEEGAVKQIKECAWLLRGLFDASTDQRRTQHVVLKGVTTLVTKKGQGEGIRVRVRVRVRVTVRVRVR